MSQKTQIFLVLAAIALFPFPSCTESSSFAKEGDLAGFFQKKNVTIAVTDSGLGGLAVMAEAVEQMKKTKTFGKVHFIFFNALFSNQGGYNSLQTRAEKIHVLNSVLESLTKKYRPDLILIGCNTLSVLYKETDYFLAAKIPVIGIVESGVDLMAQVLKAHPEARIILFATRTTVEEATHKTALIERGFLKERIITQACSDLVNYIEKGYDSDETEMLIFAYVDEALSEVSNSRDNLYVSLNCTHYGYSMELWKKAFASLGVKPRAFLNPNSSMLNFLFEPRYQNRYAETATSVSLVSMVEISPDRIDSIGRWLEEVSAQTADALRQYRLVKDLFPWKEFIRRNREISWRSAER